MTAALLAQAAPAAAGGDYLLYALILLGLATVLVVLELFLPSGGLLGLAAGVAALAAVGCFFAESATLGFSSLLGLAVVTPVIVALGLWIWPHTPVGRRLVLGGMDAEEEAEAQQEATAVDRPAVGDVGESVTPLRRVGTCRFDGRRTECLAEAGMIEAGVPVVVSRVSGNEVFVRAVLPPAAG